MMQDLKRDGKAAAKLLKDAASNAAYHTGRNSVTHTLRSLMTVIRQAAYLVHFCEKPRAFGRRFETAIMQAQVGPVEVQIREGEVTIAGTFNLDMLRKFIVVNDPTDIITLEVQGPHE